ncbi:DUF3152 domain-containing protein [Streptomyces sp. NBC_00841]|uniref:DUF3152 domain-containing protein n=1 Tax=Streptomyces sp. NBC_00841 TaxID=2975847 RepID=UPI002DD9AC03|nr:DUF3152 domain-containing protein [Streptomyces sp. NBC_00841]WSA01729.1 DUF3152 domain-containing protein [Streptomyces sp. NBC_00841]
MRRELIRGVGRHSRKGPQAGERDIDAGAADRGGAREATRPEPGSGRRRRVAGVPPGADGHTPFQGVPQVRGGHPEQREPGGGWGTGPRPVFGEQAPGRPGGPGLRTGKPQMPRPTARPMPQGMSDRQPAAGTRSLIPGPRREFVDVFDAPPAPPAPRAPSAPPADPFTAVGGGEEQPPPGDAGTPPVTRSSKGRTFTGIAAAAVTTVLAVVVAGQVAHDRSGRVGMAAPGAGVDRDGGEGTSSRSDDRPTPKAVAAVPLSYEQKMAVAYPLAPELKGSGHFETVPGTAKAPGKGHRYRYRIDVEKGLGLDAGLFAEAVQRTLNDDRSWAHDGAMTFERISSGDPDFVITLASPGTTGDWCEKSGLDTTEDNVSCDSAATERVMINAYRWAQGSSTFGPKKLFSYRQMLINHEVGHRLGHNHVSCRTAGALAPVMQQQTKSLDIDGIKCRPNAWVYPSS